MSYRRQFRFLKFLLTILILWATGSFCMAQAPDTLWTKTYDFEDRIEECWEAIATSDGGLAIAGVTTYESYSSIPYLLRIDSNGDTLWSATVNFWGIGRAICLSPENGFIVAGNFNDVPYAYPFVLKFDSLGNLNWSNTKAS